MTMISMSSFFQFLQKTPTSQRLATAVPLLGIFAIFYLWGGMPFLLFMALLWIMGLKEWITMVFQGPFLSWGIRLMATAIGTTYITFGFFGFNIILQHSPIVFLWILSIIVATDSGGYFIGKTLGGPKLAPRISPGKTISGLAGGLSCALGVSYIWSLATPQTIPMGVWVGTLLISLLSVLGDLVESGAKRLFNVKDSGTLLPGHGGILDRLDSPLAIGFATAIYFLF